MALIMTRLFATTAIGSLAALAIRDVWRNLHGRTWVSQGGAPHGTVSGWINGQLHVGAWAARNIIRHPALLVTTAQAEAEARRQEHASFYAGEIQFGRKKRIGYDNGPDAFRHTFGSALIVYRLMRRRGLDAQQAVAFLRGAGSAHERDSHLERFSDLHDRYSSAMDLHNNEVGAAIGMRLARLHAQIGVDSAAGEHGLRQAVIDAIAAGHSVVLDTVTSAPRVSRAGDIGVVDVTGRLLRGVDGMPILRRSPPDAPGYPTPLINGEVDLSRPYVRLY